MMVVFSDSLFMSLFGGPTVLMAFFDHTTGHFHCQVRYPDFSTSMVRPTVGVVDLAKNSSKSKQSLMLGRM